MTIPLFPADSTEQVWFAAHGKRIQTFGDLEGVKDHFGNRYAGTEIAWEEGEPSLEGDDWVQGRGEYRVSSLMCLTSSVRYAGSHVTQRWEDTGWRVWREQ